MRSQLSEADQQKLTKGSTDNPEAYQLYLKGKYYTNKFSKDGFRKCIDYFNQTIALDPNYGSAYNGLAYNYINQDDWFIHPNEAATKAKDAAQRALAIDESDADAHLSMAIVASRRRLRTVILTRRNSRCFILRAESPSAFTPV